MTRNDSNRDEYADWSPPDGGDDSADRGERTDDDTATDGDSSRTTELKPPTELRDPLPRDRIRTRLDVTPRQWYVIESFLLVSPYPVFVLIYLSFDVNEMAFLTVTLLYSLVAMYVGILS